MKCLTKWSPSGENWHHPYDTSIGFVINPHYESSKWRVCGGNITIIVDRNKYFGINVELHCSNCKQPWFEGRQDFVIGNFGYLDVTPLYVPYEESKKLAIKHEAFIPQRRAIGELSGEEIKKEQKEEKPMTAINALQILVMNVLMSIALYLLLTLCGLAISLGHIFIALVIIDVGYYITKEKK